MAVEAVLDIRQGGRRRQRPDDFPRPGRMLTKLAAHAELGPEQARPRADARCASRSSALLASGSSRIRTPTTTAGAAAPGDAGDSSRSAAAGLRQSATSPTRCAWCRSLEVGSVGPLVDRAVDQAIDAGQLNALLELLASPPPGGHAVAEIILALVSRPRRSSGMLAARRAVDLRGARSTCCRACARWLRDAARRAGASDEPVRPGASCSIGWRKRRSTSAPLVVARLDDERWYVQRNMLMLLAALRPRAGRLLRPALDDASRMRACGPKRFVCSSTLPRRARPGVARRPRRRRPAHRPCRAGRDRAGLSARPAAPVMSGAVAPGSDVNIRAAPCWRFMRSAGSRTRRALDALLQLADGGRSFLGRQKLAGQEPRVLAALRALADAWSAIPGAPPLALAARRPTPRCARP